MLSIRYTLRRSIKTTTHLPPGITKEELDQMTYYQILGIHSQANKQEIRKAYLKLAKRIHPDLQTSPTHEFSYIVRAYQTLSDDLARSVYDEELKSDKDYYAVSLGVGSVSIKTAFSLSIGTVLLALALRPSETQDSEACPTEFRVKKLGLQNEPIETTEEEENEQQIKWSKFNRTVRMPSKSSSKDSIYKDKLPETSLEEDEGSELKTILPKERSTLTKLQEKVKL